jgi:hypothetical protein
VDNNDAPTQEPTAHKPPEYISDNQLADLIVGRIIEARLGSVFDPSLDEQTRAFTLKIYVKEILDEEKRAGHRSGT